MKRKIITAAIGSKPYFPIGIAYLRAYAKKVGADLTVITETTRANPQHALLDAFAAASPDTHHLWMDCDIVPHIQARDLFAYCDPRFTWGAQPLGQHRRKKWRPWLKKSHPEIIDIAPYLSTAIVSFTHHHASQMMTHDKHWPNVGDQEIFNLLWRWAATPIRMIPHSIHNNYKKARQDRLNHTITDFYHCGGKGKLQKMHAVSENIQTITPI
jgi:hypothetical protein